MPTTTTLSTKKLAGGSVQTVVRRVKRVTTDFPDGHPASVYIEQEDVTYIDGVRMSAEEVDPIGVGPKDVADDDHLVAMQEVATALDDRVAVNEDNRKELAVAKDKREADALVAAADAEEIVVIDK
jgi:hypothetical protein